MPLTARTSQYDLEKEEALGSPFVSPAYDRSLADAIRCHHLLDNLIRLSAKSTVAYFRVVNGSGCKFFRTGSRGRSASN